VLRSFAVGAVSLIGAAALLTAGLSVAAAAGVPGLLGLMIAGLVAVTAMAVVVMRSTRPAARVHR